MNLHECFSGTLTWLEPLRPRSKAHNSASGVLILILPATLSSQVLLTCQFWLSHIWLFLSIPTTDLCFRLPLTLSSQLLPVMGAENPLTPWNLFSFSLKTEGIIHLWPLSTTLRKILQGSLWTFPEDSLWVLWQYKKVWTVGKVSVRSKYESKSYARLLSTISSLSRSLVKLWWNVTSHLIVSAKAKTIKGMKTPVPTLLISCSPWPIIQEAQQQAECRGKKGTSKNLIALHFIDKKQGSKTFELLFVSGLKFLSHMMEKITKVRSGQKASIPNFGSAKITHPQSPLSNDLAHNYHSNCSQRHFWLSIT